MDMNDFTKKLESIAGAKGLLVPVGAGHYVQKGIVPQCEECTKKIRKTVGLYCGSIQCAKCVLPELWKETQSREYTGDGVVELTLDKIKLPDAEYPVVELKMSLDNQGEKIIEVDFQADKTIGKAFRCRKSDEGGYHWEVYLW